MPLLDAGDPFPHLAVASGHGGSLDLPGDVSGSFGVVLFYRGSWCPFCNAQLASFSRAVPELAEVGVRVVALSVDDEQTTADLIAKHDLQFAVGHSADAEQLAEETGAFVTRGERTYVNSTGFVLDREGTVLSAVYSTGAIGRLVPADVAGFVSYVRSQG